MLFSMGLGALICGLLLHMIEGLWLYPSALVVIGGVAMILGFPEPERPPSVYLRPYKGKDRDNNEPPSLQAPPL